LWCSDFLFLLHKHLIFSYIPVPFADGWLIVRPRDSIVFLVLVCAEKVKELILLEVPKGKHMLVGDVLSNSVVWSKGQL
jgi:hypothetical protein